ncbi:MAG: right-handed parallel beta-helix repeat-containing protein [Anaerolineae bacterium]|jgi:hypothetical protein
MRHMRLVLLLPATLLLVAVTASALPVESAGDTIIITSSADDGLGSLRQALLDARSGDTITFDTEIFPPTAPVTISIMSELPALEVGNLTLDASNAGVILDGSAVSGGWVSGLQIISSDSNIVRGLQVSNFPGAGISISGGRYNTIGGDRRIGDGPSGQGNVATRNGMGIGLWWNGVTGASFNTISGNCIGSDGAGLAHLGNDDDGIRIMEASRDNTIGPDNVIAHNRGNGVGVSDRDSVHNTITENSIHDNEGMGIRLSGGANVEPPEPVVFDFDLAAGTVTGATCSNCTVEIFSDSSDQGALLEGQTTADALGVFTLDKGVPFTGPHLTATTTDIDGNTSQFSLPTSGTARLLIQQQGNDLPRTQLRRRHSSELLDNRIGYQFDSFGTPEFSDLGLYPRGAKRARVAIAGLEPEGVDWDKPELSVDPSHDDVFTRMADNGIIPTYVMVFWDKATYPGGEGLPCPRFKTQGEIDNYLKFVRFIVQHFKDRVDYYEIWNEPDVTGLCTKSIEVVDYVNLVEQTIPVIREEYPEAKIVVGGVANTASTGPSEYLFDILESPIMPLVDVVAWHPMYGASPAFELSRDYYYQYPSFVQDIRDVATARGFDGEYQADELTWRSAPTADPSEPWYSPIVASKYSGRGILMQLGMDIGAGVGEDYSLVRNLCTVMAGAQPLSLPVRIQTTVTETVSYTFSSPNDAHLVALWTDGIAVEFDPGITTTVTLPGLTDHTVKGIDVLHGFEQPIITSEEGDDLVIRDLLVKDYPIILRVSPIRRVFLPVVLKGHR